MRLLFCIICAFFYSKENHGFCPSEASFTLKHLRSIIPRIEESWGNGTFNIREDIDDSQRLKVYYLCSVTKEIRIGTQSYKYVYLESSFKKGTYKRNSTFLSFFKGHSVTRLKQDSSLDFNALTKLFAAKPQALSCDALSFHQYFPEKEESYTLSFIK